jgi:hypothetical protein
MLNGEKWFRKKIKLNYGAKRHHYSIFNVGRPMFDVQMFIISKSMTRGIFAFKYEDEKKWGGQRFGGQWSAGKGLTRKVGPPGTRRA